jgi:Membrane domain of glycerophosphoryl diester phosphodiesterase
VSIKRVLRQAWELYKKSFLRLVLTAAVIFVVLEFFAAISESAGHEHHWISAAVWGIVAFLLWIVGTFWLQGALVGAVSDLRNGRPDLSIGELYVRAQPLLPSLIAAGVAAVLGVACGLLLLVVPGLILLTRWIFIVPVIVLEKKPAGQSFGRSWELVKGSSWPVFWLILLTVIVLGVGSSLISLALFPFSVLPHFLATWIVGTVASSLTAPFAALVWTFGYFELVREQVQPSATKLPPVRI